MDQIKVLQIQIQERVHLFFRCCCFCSVVVQLGSGTREQRSRSIFQCCCGRPTDELVQGEERRGEWKFVEKYLLLISLKFKNSGTIHSTKNWEISTSPPVQTSFTATTSFHLLQTTTANANHCTDPSLNVSHYYVVSVVKCTIESITANLKLQQVIPT